MRPLIVVGGGEHARVLIEAARSRPDVWDILGYVDDHAVEETEVRLGLKRLGSDEEGRRLRHEGQICFALGFGGVSATGSRSAVVQSYGESAEWAVIVHVSAWVSPTAQVAPGSFISGGVVVNSGARIERHAIINTSAVIEHDVVLGEFSQVSPGAVIGGGTRVGRRAYIGLGARIRDHVTIGENAVIGMGAVVVSPVAEGSLVVGNPARVRKTSQ